MNSEKVTKVIEMICEEGCTSVNNIIIALEKGEPNKYTTDLDNNEVQFVLIELKEIMAVYERNQ
jgi:hypothetical protein